MLDDPWETIAKLLFVNVIALLGALLCSKIFTLIPTILNNRNYNYLLNLIINLVVFLIGSYDEKRKKIVVSLKNPFID